MTVSEVSDKILDENFGLVDLSHSESKRCLKLTKSISLLSNNELTHYGVKGMKWGVRKEYAPHPRKKITKYGSKSKQRTKSNSHLKRNIAIGTAAVGAALAAYGTYKFVKGVRDDRLEMAMKYGKEFAESMKLGDRGGSLKDIYGDRPDSYYDKYVDEKVAEAKAESFKEAYKKVKPVREQAKKAAAKHKENVKKAADVIKRMKKKEDWFGTGPSSIGHYAKYDPDVLKELKIEIKDGVIYQKGKRIN